MSINPPKHTLIILAAGNGSRLAASVPKGLICIKDKPLYAHTIEACLQVKWWHQVIVMFPQNQPIPSSVYQDFVQYYPGGATRFDSLKCALKKVHYQGSQHCIWVHDVARPTVTLDILQSLYNMSTKVDITLPYRHVADACSIVDADTSQCHSIARDRIRLHQTPQVFDATCLISTIKAYTAYPTGIFDDVALVRAYHPKARVSMILHDQRLDKITFQEDLRRFST